jgi:hypothetical protein
MITIEIASAPVKMSYKLNSQPTIEIFLPIYELRLDIMTILCQLDRQMMRFFKNLFLGIVRINIFSYVY